MIRIPTLYISLAVVVMATALGIGHARAAVPPTPGVQPLPSVNKLELTSLKTWFTTQPIFASEILDTRLTNGSLSTPETPADPPPYRAFRNPRILLARSGALEVKIGAPIVDAKITLESPKKRAKGQVAKPKILYSGKGLHFGKWPSGGTISVRFRLPGWKKLKQTRTLRVDVEFAGGSGTYRYGVRLKRRAAKSS